MRDQLTYRLVKTVSDWEELKAFAASFDHVVNDNSLTPMVMVYSGSTPVAYFAVIHGPIIVPSFHPDKISPRIFTETINQVRAYCWLNSLGKSDRWPDGNCWTAFGHNPAVPRELKEKLGFRFCGELWQSYPGIEELDPK